MTHPRVARWSVIVALFLAAVGFIGVVQLRSRQPLRQATDLPTWRLQELAVLVRQQEAARRLLEAEVDALRRQIIGYEAAINEGRGATEVMVRELGQFRMVLGLVPVEGPGVVVVVAEAPAVQVGVLPPEVQAQDLAGLANELWSAGAEAMAINGIRVLATTGIRQEDGAIAVGGTPVTAPYRIAAIGNPAALQAALAIRGGFVEGLRAVGLRVEVGVRDRLRLPARPGDGGFHHARPRSPQPARP
ncbi:MAG: DUF881 domain-containing protein [Armatimonadota bacterium]|nr:DUF881 domain-containing protein [Armatimonadota bacterium]